MNDWTKDSVETAVTAILQTLGEPSNGVQAEALNAFKADDHATVKRLAATNLDDYFVKSLGYLGSAYKLTPNTDTIVAEAARSAADHVRARALTQLSRAIQSAVEVTPATV